MIIGIDGNEANVERKVGISEYAFELLKQFNNFQFSIFNFQFVIYLKNKPRKDLPKERDGWEYRIVGPRKLWTQIALPIALFKDCRLRGRPLDIFFSPTHYAPRFSPIPTVISVMDLSYIRFPQLFKASDLYQLRSWTAYSALNAKRIFTISKASKDDIIKEYGLPEGRIVVTYPGIKLKTQMSKLKTITQNSKILKEKYNLEGDYILFVGTVQPRKNIARLIEAFSKLVRGYSSSERSESRSQGDSSRLRSNNKDLQLIVVGKKGWLFDEILAAPKKFGVEETVKFLDFVSDENLPLLYQNAKVFVLPSLYEGFGLPVLEAMAEGCPVITSNVSSLPEAGGDAALYIDPFNVSDISEKIQLVLDNDQLRKDLIKKGYEQVKKFSWEKTAKQTLEVLEEVVKNER